MLQYRKFLANLMDPYKSYILLLLLYYYNNPVPLHFLYESHVPTWCSVQGSLLLSKITVPGFSVTAFGLLFHQCRR